jgi:hypothetical protein
MSFTYGIGLRRLVPDDAPVLNADATEDVCFSIQSQLATWSLRFAEICPAGTDTLTGTADGPFVIVFEEHMVGGMGTITAEQQAHAEQVLTGWGSLPNSIELPGITADILIPNLPGDEGPWMDQLAWHQPLEQADFHFGRKMWIGSLDATLAVLEQHLAEADADRQEMLADLVEQMALAKRLDLAFTFRF